MRAIILGATGAIGKDLVQELINDDTIEQIAIFVRRDPGINNEKVTTHIETSTSRMSGDSPYKAMSYSLAWVQRAKQLAQRRINTR